MRTKTPKFRYIDWKTPDEMHFSSLQWQSELNFYKDEQRFFEDMLKEYTMPIIESNLFSRIQDLITELSASEKELKQLHEQVNDHTNRLERLVENVDEPSEGRTYRQQHKNILQLINDFTKRYKQLKKDIFGSVTEALKHQKQKRLLS
ncbi:hypothetical protein [Salinimicrobium gaetbulicola]|uniref:Uncharacterized protein n=1 Tax=Salinimicrobium gaetbulicola TaxID=999702 RepID=A0ABW3IFN4_9FLAO